jgi:hypothetical protein
MVEMELTEIMALVMVGVVVLVVLVVMVEEVEKAEYRVVVVEAWEGKVEHHHLAPVMVRVAK